MSGQNTLITCAEDNQIKRPSGTLISRQVYRNRAPQGAGVYKAMDENGNIEIIGGPGSGFGIPFGNDIDPLPNNIQASIPNATLTDAYTFEVRVLTDNTGPTTMQINALGVKNVVDTDGNALVGAELQSTQIYLFSYNLDNDNYQLLGLAKPAPDELWESGTGVRSAKLINPAFPNDSSGDFGVSWNSGNQASGENSTAFGKNTVADGPRSTANGNATQALAPNSIAEGDDTAVQPSSSNGKASGQQALAVHLNEQAFSSGQFSTRGDSQTMQNVIRKITSNAAPAKMATNGVASNLGIPDNTAWKFTVDLVAIEGNTGDALSRQFQGLIKRYVGVTTVLVNTLPVATFETQIAQDAGLPTATAVIDTVNSAADNALVVTVTGEANKDILWTAFVRLTQVTTPIP